MLYYPDLWFQVVHTATAGETVPQQPLCDIEVVPEGLLRVVIPGPCV